MEAEDNPVPSLSEKVDQATQEGSPKKPRTSSTDSSGSESVSEIGSPKTLKMDKKLKRDSVKVIV
jgi:hypothetical protein